MLADIADINNLISRANKLKQKTFKPGFDNMTADSAVLWLEINGVRLSKEIKNGTYTPMPAMGFRTAKKNGRFRQIARLTALDTVIEYSILECLNEIYEPLFSKSSFAYRTGFGTGKAIAQYSAMATQYKFAAKYDPVSCFDNIDHDVLLNMIAERVKEKKATELIYKFIKMPIYTDGELLHPDKGILQGAPISPVLCNIYFDRLDKFLEDKQIPFIRFADDIVVFGETYGAADTAYHLTADFVETQLKLEPNKAKCTVNNPARITYLGYKFTVDKKGIVAIEADSTPRSAYYTWYSQKPTNNRRRADLLSDGILRQKDFSLLFETDTDKNNLPVETLDVINIYSSTVFDSGVLERAFDNRIIINVFNKNNRRIGSFMPDTALKSPQTTFEQLNAYYNEDARLKLAANFVLSSIHNIRLNIRNYNKNKPKPVYNVALQKLDEIFAKVKTCQNYEKLLLLEANSKEIYYGCFDFFIEGSGLHFNKRTRRPPENEMNSLISFGNTVLYNLIATEINKTPLDIRVGFLHATNTRKESLNLDIADVFKPLLVDRVTFSLINKKMLEAKDFRREENGGVYLTRDGMLLFLREFYEKLDTTVTVNNKKMQYNQILIDEIRKLVRHFRTGEKYIPFRQVR